MIKLWLRSHRFTNIVIRCYDDFCKRMRSHPLLQPHFVNSYWGDNVRWWFGNNRNVSLDSLYCSIICDRNITKCILIINTTGINHRKKLYWDYYYYFVLCASIYPVSYGISRFLYLSRKLRYFVLSVCESSLRQFYFLS